MKIAFLSESPADEAAIRILVEGLLDSETELCEKSRFVIRGWSDVFKWLEPVVKYLYYGTDAEALVVVVDSDDTPIHTRAHGEPDGADSKCRLCKLRTRLADIQRCLSHMPGREPLKTTVGLAVPAIEAWYLVGRNRQVSETAWMLGQQSRKPPYTKLALKKQVYDTDRPSLVELEIPCATREANRIVEQKDLLKRLVNSFSGGFGALADDVRQW